MIEPYLFENAAGDAKRLNVLRYREMLNDLLLSKLIEYTIDQQNGATYHASIDTMDLMRKHFPRRVITRNSNFNWPLRSCI